MNTRIQTLIYLLVAMMSLVAYDGRAQNLFVSSAISSGYITQIEPGVATNVYATGFSYPVALAFDNKGDLFEMNAASDNIIKITPSGMQIPFAGGLSSSAVGMAMDSSNNLFVADFGYAHVEEFTPNGTAITVVSNVPTSCVAVDGAGNLYVGEYSGNILEFTNNGGTYSSNSTFFATVPQQPLALAFNSFGDLFVYCYYAYTGSGGITEVTPGGMQSTFSPFYEPVSQFNPITMTFNSTGDLFLSDPSQGTVLAFTPGGVQSTFASGLTKPSGVAFQPTITIPRLSIAPLGNQSVLFWPATNGNFLLQSVTNLNCTNWTTVSNSVPIIGFTVTNASPSQFFRLEQQ